MSLGSLTKGSHSTEEVKKKEIFRSKCFSFRPLGGAGAERTVWGDLSFVRNFEESGILLILKRLLM